MWSFLLFLSLSAGASGWSSFRNGFQNRANHDLEVRKLSASGRTVKSVNTGGLFWGTAVIDEKDNAYVGATNKFFYSFAADGSLRWKYQIYDRADSLIDSAAVLAPDNLVVVPGGDGFLHALNRDTGKLVWDFKAKGTSDLGHQKGETVNSFEGNVQVGPNGVIYAGNDNGHMYSVSAAGKELWNIKTDMMIWSSPSFDPKGEWMVFGSLDGYLYLVHPQTGKIFSKEKIGADVKSSPSVDEEGNITFGASNFLFYSYKVEKKKLVKNWEYNGARGELYSSAAVKDGKIVFGSLEGAVYALSKDGKLLWKFMTYSPVASSPMITKDNVVLFGAKNGKLYALDLLTGERLWSFKTTDALQKSNLDASVSMNSKGMIINGSYSGIVYQIPYEFCMKNKSDARCEFGDKNDSPDFGRKLDPQESTLVYFNSRGKFELTPSAKIGLTEMLKLQLVVLDKGVWQIDRAINTAGLKITIKPEVAIRTEVSSDGQHLNIFPEKAFAAGTDYEITVNGSHYEQTTWLKDRLAYFGHKDLKANLKFTTVPNIPLDKKVLEEGTLGFRSLYLQQPQALDTYIPAALDGQGFVARAFAINEEKKTYLFYVIPALPRDGDMLPLPEASKVFTIEGFLDGNSLRTKGKVKLSAMGGTIDFNFMTIRGVLPEYGGSVKDTFYNETNCLSIKGNGSGYTFPMKLINRVCGPVLQLKAVGEIEVVHYVPEKTPGMFPKLGHKVEISKHNLLSVTVDAASTAPRIVSYVIYESGSQKVIQRKTKIVKAGQTQKFGNVGLKKDQSLVVFVDQEMIIPRQ